MTKKTLFSIIFKWLGSGIDLDRNDIDKSFKVFSETNNSLLDLHVSYKKIPKYLLIFRDKPWITSGIQKSVSISQSLLNMKTRIQERKLK